MRTPRGSSRSRNDEALGIVVEAALAASPSLAVPALPRGHRAEAVIEEASRSRRRLTLVQPAHSSPYVDTRADVESYWARMSGNARRDFRRCRRLLQGVPDVAQRVLENPRDLRSELARGFAIEGSGWKSERGTAILDAPETTAFYEALGEAFAALGKLKLSELSIGGEPVAFNFNIVDHGRVWGLKGGNDVAYSKYAPGMLLILAEIERCFELGLQSHELLGDESGWKRKFTREVRPHVDVRSYALRPAPLVEYAWRRSVRPGALRAYCRAAIAASRIRQRHIHR